MNHFRPRLRLLSFWVLWMPLLSLALHAQSTSSSLHGLVVETDGAPVSGAAVEAYAVDLGITRTATSDEDGRFRFELLPPGPWLVVARHEQGSSDSQVIELRLQQTGELTLRIGAGSVDELTVSAARPVLDAARTSQELRIRRSQSEELPLLGRDATDLAKLDSAVRAPPPGNFYGERETLFVVNGATGRSNSYLVDGLDNNDQTSGTSLNSFFSQQVIKEFVVLTSQYAPEFGRASGGILNIITERGDNDLRGGFFLQGIPESWNGSGDFLDGLPMREEGQDAEGRLFAGFHVGGPIQKDKSFYFAAFEHQREDDIVPYTGVDRSGEAGGWTTGTTRNDSLFVRTDFNVDQKHLVMLRLSGSDRSSEGLNVGGVRTPEAGFSIDEEDLQAAISVTSFLTEDLQNEARFLFGHSSFAQSANSSRPGVQRPSGIFGGNNLNRQAREEDRFQFIDNVTLYRERHTMKFGFDLILSSTDVSTRFNPNGNFLYDTDDPFEPGDCGDLLVSDVLMYGNDPIPCPGVVGVDDDGDGQIDEPGLISTYPVVYQLINGQPEDTFDDTAISVFAQDSWDISPRFHVNYGLRYDLNTYELPEDAKVDSIIPNGGASRDTDNIGPRVGFTYRPGRESQWLLRGGAGVFYDKLVLAFPAVAAVTSGTSIGLLFPQGLTLELTEDTVEELGVDQIRSSLIFPENLVLRFSTATELDTPYTIQYSFGGDRAFGDRGLFRFNAVRALGYHSPVMRDLNPVVEEDALGIPIHRDPDVGSIAAITTEGRRWYTGVDVSWQWRNARSWYSASYTWSRAEDMGPDPLKGGIYLPPNSDDLSEEKGRTDSDRRHRLVLAGAFELPWWKLRASAVLQLASGAPFNVTTGRDENKDGIATDRPLGMGRNTGEDSDLSAINAIRAEQGLDPVKSLNEPSLTQLDLRLSKAFPLKSTGGSGEVFMQVFNVLDEFNGGPVEGRVTARDFGKSTGYAGPPRSWELGLRLTF